MRITLFVAEVAAWSLFMGFVIGAMSGWFGLFLIFVWCVVAFIPALILDFILLSLGARLSRRPAQ